MKRFIMVAVLVMALTALLASTALAAGPTGPAAQGFGPGRAMQAQGTTPGTCTMDGAGMSQMRRGGAPAWAGQPEEVAELLDMTTEEIQAARQAGKSLAQIAAESPNKVGVDALVDTILTAKKADLAELVADGKLSQEQADLMIERMTEQVKVMVERTTTGPAEDRGQGMGRSQGMRGQDDDAQGQGMGRSQGMRGGRGNR